MEACPPTVTAMRMSRHVSLASAMHGGFFGFSRCLQCPVFFGSSPAGGDKLEKEKINHTGHTTLDHNVLVPYMTQLKN